MISSKVLEWQKVGVQMGVSRQLLATMELEQVDDMLRDQMLVRLKAWFLADRLEDDVIPVYFTRMVPVERFTTFREPASWWDHWKRDKAPRWLRRRLKPVRYVQATRSHKVKTRVTVDEEVRIERRLGYPDASRVFPREEWGKPVYFETYQRP